MATAGSLLVNIIGKTDGLQQGADRARKLLDSFTSHATRALSTLAGAFALRESIAAIETQLVAERKLQAVLEATGHAAGITAEEIKKLAAARQETTNFGDEGTINAAAILGTFTQIRGDEFKSAITLAQDMASVMDGDLKSSILQVGKALNDPIKGVGALAEVGVSFNDTQREMIKNLVDGGDVMGAQRVIIKELQREFGGAAEAMVTDSQQIRNTLGDIAEEIGRFVLPALKGTNNLLKWMGGNSKSAATGILALAGGYGVYRTVLIAVDAWQKRVAVSATVLQAITSGGLSVLKNALAIGASVAVTYGALTAAQKLLGEETEKSNAALAKSVKRMTSAGLASDFLKNKLAEQNKERDRLNEIGGQYWKEIDKLHVERVGLLFGDEAAREAELKMLGFSWRQINGIVNLEREITKLKDQQQLAKEKELETSRKMLEEETARAQKWENIADEAKRLAETPLDQFTEKLFQFNAIKDELGKETFLNAVGGLAEQFGVFDDPNRDRPVTRQAPLTAVSGMDAISAVNQFNADMAAKQQEAAKQQQRDAKTAEFRKQAIKAMQAIGVPIEKLEKKINVAEAVPGGPM